MTTTTTTTSTTTMPVHVLPVEDADMDRVFEIGALAFYGIEPIWDTIYPSSWTATGRQVGAERMRVAKAADAQGTWLKAVDNSTGEIVGMARWYVLDGVVPDNVDTNAMPGAEPHFWDNADDRVYFTQFMPLFWARRRAAVARTQGNLVGLDTLAVHPEHQRRKVGDALVKWGTRKADDMGVEAVVESSVCGKGLYEKNGFVFQEDCEVQVPGTVDRPPGKFAWLIRPKPAAAER